MAKKYVKETLGTQTLKQLKLLMSWHLADTVLHDPDHKLAQD